MTDNKFVEYIKLFIIIFKIYVNNESKTGIAVSL